MNYRRTFAVIDLKNLSLNVHKVRALTDGSFFCPMVKANAYGHGDIAISKHLEKIGVENLGVVTVDEGVTLRKAQVEANVFVFSNFDSESAEACIRHRLTPVISTFKDLENFRRLLTGAERYPIHLKFNTGMNRLGFDLSDLEKLESLKSDSHFEIDGICTHFLNGEDAGVDGKTQEQLKKFQPVIKSFANVKNKHYHNSASIIQMGNLGGGARPGLSIYGLLPAIRNNPQGLQLNHVLELKSEVALVRTVKKGESVSYGPSWVADKDSVVALVPIGYADGWRRSLSNKSFALINGAKVPQVGTICMDYLLLDVTSLKGKIEIGDEVVFIGKLGGLEITAKDVADSLGTIPYEVLTGISQRIPRVYTHGG